ncbi:MAG: FHA domain-containing protein [Candidatus Krumholzibacteriota bacterium]|nr:FHA domain-containing protein [Candidatus Krumholzibacteriota bacterium]
MTSTIKHKKDHRRKESKNPRLRSKNHSRTSKATLTITNGCFAGLKISLEKLKISLGSDISCDICLDHSFVSEEHAIISRSGDNYILEDLNSRHGTSINGKEIHRCILRNGDRIGIGDFTLLFSG